MSGIDSVDFGPKDRDTCLKSIQAGTMHAPNAEEAHINWSECAAYDKNLGF